jgi:hypothetical protein
VFVPYRIVDVHMFVTEKSACFSPVVEARLKIEMLLVASRCLQDDRPNTVTVLM